jgi:hypothetical protein
MHNFEQQESHQDRRIRVNKGETARALSASPFVAL